jgi:hypothetical protein
VSDSAESQVSTGLVYVLTNAAMPGLIKIGITSASDPATRASQLYTTGVPVPFDVEFAGEVERPGEVERALHNAFRDHRVNPKREFFRIDPDQPIVLLKAFSVVDVTAAVSGELLAESSAPEQASKEKLRKRRPSLNFTEMGIPLGAELVYIADDSVRVRVIDAKKIEYEGTEMSLSAVTRDLKGLDYYVQPTSHWRYDSRSLSDLYGDAYPLQPD